ncbi:GNAT family protein [Streptomyces sp. B1866]|uniref:GNAT family N-acetyltransferase n=1 Tax=Streptomyces sp. B1866 TaxID=3075431 RepID=UPI00288FB906|nr:GNAT family protein [Streptomyces sp. B1866]MDT3398685.1 GNAT family protein [Streptomyces sp. B1866]
MAHPPFLAQGARAAIRRFERRDGAEFTALARMSRDLHHPWLSPPTTDEAFADYLARLSVPDREGLLVCVRATGAIAGFINVNNIVRNAFQSGALGYGAFASSAGRGLMSEGLALVLRHAFGPLGLHRLEANIQPGNEASARLVKRAGFRLEGYSPAFLYVNGAWRDHERWALTGEMWEAGVAAPR